MDPDPAPRPPPRSPSWVGRLPEVRFLELFEKYRQKVVHHETGLPFPPSPRSPRPLSLERLAFQTKGGLKLALSAFTPACVAMFALSFLWDWHGLLRAWAVSGVIGFGTNWIAIKMLFWPRESRPVFGHGLIPSQRDDLVDKVATEVLENLINEELILRKIHETRIVNRFTTAAIGKLRQVAQDPEFKEDLRRMVLTYVGELARDPAFRDRVARSAEARLEEFAGERFRGWLVRRLKDVWRGPLVEMLDQELEQLDRTLEGGMAHFEQIAERFPTALEARQADTDRVLTDMLVGLVHEVDLREIIYEQLDGVDAEQLERAFLEFSDDKLSYITLLGGMFGVVGGTLIVWPLASVALIVLGVALLYVADLVAYRVLHGRWASPFGAARARPAAPPEAVLSDPP